jgi:uncharacterized tellurite resistance protein B-like protein
MILHSSFPDFILFLYVHMSHADSSYDPLEMAAIKRKMSELYPEGTDIEKKLYRTIREYNSFDKLKLNDLFRETLGKFSLDIPKNNTVYTDLYEIMQADGKIDQSETKVLETLKQIIALHVGEKSV